MKEITVPEQLVQNLQRLGYWRLCRREEGVFAVDAQRHALLESLQTLKHPTATEQALIDEITKSEADALANHKKSEDDAHKAICDLYEKTRLCVKDMLLGKYLRISLNDGYRRYLHVRGVKMYSLGARVCIFGSEFKINNLVGSIEYHEGTEFVLFRSDDVIKQTTCLNIEDALRVAFEPYEYIEYDDIVRLLGKMKEDSENTFNALIDKAQRMKGEDMFEDCPANAEEWW